MLLRSLPVQPRKDRVAPRSLPARRANEEEAPPVSLSLTATAGQRTDQAWKILIDAATDVKHTQTRLQALTALGLLRSPRSAKLIADAMTDPGLDVRSAAALAAGLSRDRTLEAQSAQPAERQGAAGCRSPRR